MRHDYDLPPNWAAMTDEEKSDWMTQERCRRQNKRIQSDSVAEYKDNIKDRVTRILRARGYIDPKR